MRLTSPESTSSQLPTTGPRSGVVSSDCAVSGSHPDGYSVDLAVRSRWHLLVNDAPAARSLASEPLSGSRGRLTEPSGRPPLRKRASLCHPACVAIGTMQSLDTGETFHWVARVLSAIICRVEPTLTSHPSAAHRRRRPLPPALMWHILTAPTRPTGTPTTSRHFCQGLTVLTSSALRVRLEWRSRPRTVPDHGSE